MTSAANDLLLMKHHERKPWLTNGTFFFLRERSAASLVGDMNRVRQQHSVFGSKVRADKEAVLSGIADGVEDGRRINNLDAAYKAMKLLSSSHPQRNAMGVHKQRAN